MKSLLFFSNPFGYGPTATMMAVLRHFTNLTNVKIYVIARGLCAEILDNNTSNIQIVDIDQRDVKQIQSLLKQHKDPYVISSLNRFAVLAAKELSIPSCFIDTLTYLWDKIPDDYLKADIYYANDFPTVLDKMSGHDNAIATPLIIDKDINLITPSTKRQGTILQLGGLKSPLSDLPPTDYLNLIAYCLNTTKHHVTVTGGKDGLKYLQTKVSAPNIRFESLTKNDFLHKLSVSELCISTPGLNTTIESLFLGTPISFIMPTNLSQWVNYNIFRQFETTGIDITWENLTDGDLNINGLPEYDAIIKINQLAQQIQQTPSVMAKLRKMFEKTVSQIPIYSKQCAPLTKYGTDGAEFIFKDICTRWRLN